ncbi:MAG: protochlorophyllide oxidoreductase [Euryarchaeota archaeon]|nr:protochlorophyllide oxidoreductase [Euryarchaeota archaeon]
MQEHKEMRWTPEAQELFKNVPDFVKDWARQRIEMYAREKGREEVTEEDVKEVYEKYRHGT